MNRQTALASLSVLSCLGAASGAPPIAFDAVDAAPFWFEDADADSVAERGCVVTPEYSLEWVPLEEMVGEGADATRVTTRLGYSSMSGGFSTPRGIFFGRSDDYALDGAIGGKVWFTQFQFAGGVTEPNTIINFDWLKPGWQTGDAPEASLAVRFPQAGNFGYTINFGTTLRLTDTGIFRLNPATAAENGTGWPTQGIWITSASAPSIGTNVGAPGVGDGSAGGSVFAFAFTTQTPCYPDLTVDAIVEGADLGLMLGVWGSAGGPADLNADGVVNGADLGILLGAWGPCP